MTQQTIALIGCGKWGKLILRDLVAMGCEVPVVVTSMTSQAVRIAGDGGASRIVTELSELPHIDGIVVATPTTTHAAVVEDALRYGVPVFVEKPLTDNVEAADRLASIGANRLFVMDKWRYHPGVKAMRDIAKSGELGPVIGLRSTRTSWGKVHDDTDAVWVLAPHDISIALEIFGHIPEPRAAVAERDGSGLLAILGDDPWVVIDVSSNTVERRRETRLICRDGVAILSDTAYDRIDIARPGPLPTTPVVERRAVSTEMPLERELRAFVAHITGGPPPRSSAVEAADNVRALATLRKLAEHQKAIA